MDHQAFEVITKECARYGRRQLLAGLLGTALAVALGRTAVARRGRRHRSNGRTCIRHRQCRSRHCCKAGAATKGLCCRGNARPVVINSSFSGDEGSTCIQISLVGSDADGEAITFKATSLPTNGNLFNFDSSHPESPGDPVVVNTPIPWPDPAARTITVCYRPTDHGTDSFTYTATDPLKSESDPATISITINEIN